MKGGAENVAGLDVLATTADYEAAIEAAGNHGLVVYYGGITLTEGNTARAAHERTIGARARAAHELVTAVYFKTCQ
jgi:hypothetical protein